LRLGLSAIATVALAVVGGSEVGNSATAAKVRIVDRPRVWQGAVALEKALGLAGEFEDEELVRKFAADAC
jgi:hypothetical protein